MEGKAKLQEPLLDATSGNLEIGEADTVGNLTMNALGSGLGGALLVAWAT